MGTYLAVGVGLLGDNAGAVLENLGNGEANVFTALHEVLEAGIVAAADIRRALDQVARDQRAGNRVQIGLAVPTVPPHGRAHRRRRIGNAAANDDIGTLTKRLSHAGTAQVALGTHNLVAPLAQRLARHQADKVLAFAVVVQPLHRVRDVVAGHPRHLEVQPLLLDLGQHDLGEKLRIAGARVDGQLDVLGLEVGQGRLQVLHKRGIVQTLDLLGKAALGLELFVFNLLCAVQRHGALGQPVADDAVDVAVLSNVADGALAIGEAARAAGDADAALCRRHIGEGWRVRVRVGVGEVLEKGCKQGVNSKYHRPSR